MKSGKSLVELAKEIQRINEMKRDFVVPLDSLRAMSVEKEPTKKDEKPKRGLALAFTNGKTHYYDVNSWSGSQLASYTDIPKAYFDRLTTENPGLVADNVNHGFDRIRAAAKASRKPESRLIRTLDGNIRGLLSSRYRILDSHDMLEAVLPVMQKSGMEIVSSEVTDRRLYIKALSPRLRADIKRGDTVQHGLVISTSDVGAGSVRVEPLIYRLVCENGMISESAFRKYHVGRNQAEDDVRELLSDKTREMTDNAFWASVQDIVLASLKRENFEKEVDKLRLAANEPIKNFDMPRVVELAMKATGVTGEGKKNSILAALASGNEGAGLTKWGLINSFTRAAHVGDFTYEESIEMERAAGQIVELPKSQWNLISATA